MTQTPRATAVAKQDQSIADNVAKIEQAKRHNALQLMASRLNISASSLVNTLRATVFSKANDNEFAALMVVANAYRLNPLTKEIYAFPAKGGGIVPVVSIDGWIRIANEHAMMDGFSQEEIPDTNGKLMAVKTVMWRKDRTRPIEITSYLEECQSNTEPWKKLPARMLGHKSFIQCARYAFGFSGIYDEDDGRMIGDVTLAGDYSGEPMPTRLVTSLPEHNLETGEIVDKSEDQPNDFDQLDSQTGMIKHPAEAKADEIIAAAAKCTTVIDLNALREREAGNIEAMPDEIALVVVSAFEGADARLVGR